MKLFHFSEDPTIEVFHPHVAATAQIEGAYVWAIDDEHAPLYWFPRDCPRITYWRTSSTPPDVVERFFRDTEAARVHVVESSWLARMRDCALFRYTFDAGPFARVSDVDDGMWFSTQTVVPRAVSPVGDVLALHAGAGIELRLTPSLRPVRDAIVEVYERDARALAFSMVRLRNAATR